jgi:serine/threonine protein phosphatase PrpC
MGSGQESNIRYTAVGITDVGRVREHNEDNYLVVDLGTATRAVSGQVLTGPVQQRGLSLVVADGMGGAAAGEVASQMAVDGLHGEFRDADLGGTVRSEPDVIGLLESAINKANEGIFRKGQDSKEHQGMGTTLTASVVLGDSLYLSQVGDSRGYILRKGKLVQMTRDQSLIGQLIEEGTLTEEQAEKLGGKNIILQALGVEETLKIDSKRYEILRGDTLLLCSDGLSGMVPDPKMEEILTSTPDLPEAGRKLIEAANANGGKDNITCILARFEGEGLREPLQPLSDTEKAGGTFHAPPPPKSKAGRNAVIATAAILAVIFIILFLPKAVLVRVKAGPVACTVTIKAAPEGGPSGFTDLTGTAGPAGPAEFKLDRKRKYLIVVSAEGYTEQPRPLDTDTDFAEVDEVFTLLRVPAKSFDLLPPLHEGKALSGVRVQLVPLEGQAVLPAVVVKDGEVEFTDRFPAGRWMAKLDRAGFESADTKEFDVPSGKTFELRLDPMTESRGALVVRDAAPGSQVLVLEGDEPLSAPEVINATRATRPLPVRATEVTVQVTKEGHRPFSQKVVIEKGKTKEVTLLGHQASLTLRGPAGTVLRLKPRDREQGRVTKAIDPKGTPQTFNLEPGEWEIRYTLPDAVDDVLVPLNLEPGQILEKEVTELGK